MRDATGSSSVISHRQGDRVSIRNRIPVSNSRGADGRCSAIAKVPSVRRDRSIRIRTGCSIKSDDATRSRVCRGKGERGRWELICQEVQDLGVAWLDVEDNIPERVPGRTSGAQVVLNPQGYVELSRHRSECTVVVDSDWSAYAEVLDTVTKVPEVATRARNTTPRVRVSAGRTVKTVRIRGTIETSRGYARRVTGG